MMARMNIFFLLPLLVSLSQSLPTNTGGLGEDETLLQKLASSGIDDSDSQRDFSVSVDNVTYVIDYFLVRKELQYALQDVISYKEATTAVLDTITPPAPDAANEIRWTLDGLRVTAFYAYDKLIFLANSKFLTLTYATQTFAWYERAFFHFTGRIGVLSAGLDNATSIQVLSLRDQIVSQTNEHHYIVKLLLTPD